MTTVVGFESSLTISVTFSVELVVVSLVVVVDVVGSDVVDKSISFEPFSSTDVKTCS